MKAMFRRFPSIKTAVFTDRCKSAAITHFLEVAIHEIDRPNQEWRTARTIAATYLRGTVDVGHAFPAQKAVALRRISHALVTPPRELVLRLAVLHWSAATAVYKCRGDVAEAAA